MGGKEACFYPCPLTGFALRGRGHSQGVFRYRAQGKQGKEVRMRHVASLAIASGPV